MMVAEPAPTAVTRPFEATVATSLLSDSHVTVVGPVLPSLNVAVADTVIDWPTSSSVLPAVTETAVTVGDEDEEDPLGAVGLSLFPQAEMKRTEQTTTRIF